MPKVVMKGSERQQDNWKRKEHGAGSG